MRLHAFTSAAPNYIGKVLTLGESLRHHCPDLTLHWLVADTPDHSLRHDLASGPFHKLTFATELRAFQDRGWLFSHSLVELSTAIKPAFARQLLELRECDGVLYFDPDTVVFSPLPDVVGALAMADVILTPHLLAPEMTHEAVLDNELCALKHGVFNLGFFGVRNTDEGQRFLDWWHQRLTHFCRAELAEGLFTDQKWLNFAPIFFEGVQILRQSRLNVAPWNITQRQVTGTFDTGFLVDGQPLGFYHFTGFDSGAHYGVLQKYAPDNQSLRMLVEWYSRRTASLVPDLDLNWRLGRYDDGQPVTTGHRHIYRSRSDLRQAFPNPYQTGEDCFLHWLQTQGPLEYPRLAVMDKNAPTRRTPL